MTAFILAALPVTPLRFVYVDPKGYVRLYGVPNVRSSRRQSRQPDLSPDGRRFVYWIEGDASEPYDAMVEHDLGAGRERILRHGIFRTPRYAADGRTLIFSEMLDERWSLLALDLATLKAHVILKPEREPKGSPKSGARSTGDLLDPVPQADGTVVAHDVNRMVRVDAEGRIVDTKTVELPLSANSADPDFLAPAPPPSEPASPLQSYRRRGPENRRLGWACGSPLDRRCRDVERTSDHRTHPLRSDALLDPRREGHPLPRRSASRTRRHLVYPHRRHGASFPRSGRRTFRRAVKVNSRTAMGPDAPCCPRISFSPPPPPPRS